MEITYVIKAGDTLSRIGTRYGVPWQEIVRRNGIQDPRGLHPGDVIIIPLPEGRREQPLASNYDVQDGPYTRHRFQRARGARPRWIIVHDPVGGSVEATLRVLRANASEVSYHEMMAPGRTPTAYVLAQPADRIGHAGVATRIPGTNVVNGACNDWTYGFCFYKHRDDSGPFDPRLISAAALRVADLIIAMGLRDAGVVLAHREISTERSRRFDPRGLDMEAFRHAVATMLVYRRGR